jgi:hypothetical protein
MLKITVDNHLAIPGIFGVSPPIRHMNMNFAEFRNVDIAEQIYRKMKIDKKICYNATINNTRVEY